MSHKGFAPNTVLVSLGHCPAIHVRESGAVRKVRLNGATLACNPEGNRLYVLLKKNPKLAQKHFTVAKTDYIPKRHMNAAGTFKKNVYWTHQHTERGGKEPTAVLDSSAKVIRYGPGTYTVEKWLER